MPLAMGGMICAVPEGDRFWTQQSTVQAADPDCCRESQADVEIKSPFLQVPGFLPLVHETELSNLRAPAF